MELYGKFDVRVNEANTIEEQLREIAEEIMETADEDGFVKMCVIVFGEEDTSNRGTRIAYAYVEEDQ